MTPRNRVLSLALVAGWAVPALVAIIGFQIVPSARNPGIPLHELAVSQFLSWFAWALWSPAIIALSRRVPFDRTHWPAALLSHIALAIAIISLQVVYMAYVWEWFNLLPVRGLSSKLAFGWRSYGDLYVVVYGAVVGAHAAVRWYEAWQEQRLLSAQLQRDLASAQLSALRSQLNPHFLFNALNSVVTLIGRDQDGARRMVVRIGDLLRATLNIADEPLIPLASELELVRNYLEIERVRFADRLRVDWIIDPAAGELLVPAFVLQPIVENSIVHGISRISGTGLIGVSARVTGNAIEMTVEDNGPGPNADMIRAGGIGLRNLRARLESLYASGETSLSITRNEHGGTTTRIVVPVLSDFPPQAVTARSA